MSTAYTTVWTEHCAAIVWNWNRIDHSSLGGGWYYKPDMVQWYESVYASVTTVGTIFSIFVASWICLRSNQMNSPATLHGSFVLSRVL